MSAPLLVMSPPLTAMSPAVKVKSVATVTVPVKLAALLIVWELIAPLVVTVPMLTKLPELSMRLTELVWMPPPVVLMLLLAVAVPVTLTPVAVTAR